MSATRSYYAPGGASTRFYDIATAADRSLDGELDIYAGLAEGRETILELGAGTGRVAIALAERGFRVTGLDLAPAMLAQAERKRQALPPQIADRLRFVQGDLTALSIGQPFDAIFVTFFTLSHIHPATGWKKAFAGMARTLAPGGIVALHLPIAERLALDPPPPHLPVLERPIEDGRTLTVYVASRTMDPKLGRMDLSIDYVISHAGRDESRSRERLVYFTADPAPYAARVGLMPAGDPISLNGTSLIHVFRKD